MCMRCPSRAHASRRVMHERSNRSDAAQSFPAETSPISLVTRHTSLVTCVMNFISLEQLPFVGMSHEFVGETQGAPFSAYIVKADPGQGPPLHKHPYVEVAFTLEGYATITVGDETREVKAGGIVVIPADTPHRFVNSGDTLLRQIDIHASPTFVQTNL
jgi:quercetin dioxygenase-like cupin family protein